MKKVFIILFCLLCFHRSNAQCTGGIAAGTVTPTTSWQFVNNIAGGTYCSFNAVAGNNYFFSFCSADGGSSFYDTQITLLNPAGNPVMLADDNYCGFNARLDFKCTISATYRVLVTKYDCIAQNNMGKLAYKMQSIPVCPGGLGSGVINVASLPYSSGSGSTSGSVNDLTSADIIVCGSSTYLTGEDKIWKFTPAIGGNVTITLTTSNTRAGFYLYKGCPLNGSTSICLGSALGNGNPTLTTCVEQGSTYYVVVDSRFPSSNFTYTNFTISAPSSVSSCSIGTVNSIANLPYSSIGRSTCGKGNDITRNAVEVCGNSSYLDNEDEVFSFTPGSSGNVNIGITSSASYTGIFLYEGCPLTTYCSGTGHKCITGITSASGSKSLCGYVTAGKTYYIIIDSYLSCFSYNISVSSPVANLTGATCANPQVIGSLPYKALKESTSCLGDDYNNYTPGTCGTLFESGEDKVYSYTSTGPECLAITIYGASSNSVGYCIYNGIPGNPGVTCIANGGGAYSGTLTGSVTLPSAGTYYLIIDTWADPATVLYNLSVISSTSSISNDGPCNAIPLPLGVNMTSDNSCSSNTGEPAAPACWQLPNVVNTLWYSFIAPASGKATIRTTPGTLVNTQIAVYTGPCGASMTYLNCNDNATACGGTTTYLSQLALTGLSPDAMYYIAVDGYSSYTGTFGINVTDGAASLPVIPGQDCSSPVTACSNIVSVGDPGFQSFGNFCDFPGGGSNCISTGERGTVWYEIHINNTGNLEFTIVPNDWQGNASLESTDYDFVMWKINGSGATSCSAIATGATPVRCNFHYLGVTGLYGAGNGTENPAYPGFGAANQSKLAVTNGEVYLLAISNFSNSVSGFRLEFANTSPVDFSNSNGTVQWTGGVDNDWFKAENWGGCVIPSCTMNAIILPSSANQPEINTTGAIAKSVTIAPGSTLTILSGNDLSVCENFTNNGLLTAKGNSTISLTGSGAQTISGNFTDKSPLQNLVINKTGETVTLLNDIAINGNFNISNSTGNVNAGGKKISLKGDFINSGGTFTAGINGIFEFSGSTTQAYKNSGVLNSVIMNHTGTGVTLVSDLIIGSSGTLNLNQGKIITSNNYEVNVMNDASAAVSGGNSNSFIQGALRRSLPSVQNPRSYDFPVGDAVNGFQRINLAFYNGADPNIQNLKVNFNTYGSLPGAVGTDPSCTADFNTSALNNGYWTVIPQGAGMAEMHMTLFNTNYSNAAAINSVMSKINNGAWFIPSIVNGGCVASLPSSILRNGIRNDFAAGVPVHFGTAQGTSALPIKLLSFIAEAGMASINCTWMTASEMNNKGFELQRAVNPDVFEDIAWLDGKGNTNQLSTYTFEDKEVRPNTLYYYRLRQVDFDGNVTLSKVVAAIIRDKGYVVYDAYPNPYRETTVIRYILTRPTIVTLEITDMSGRLVKKFQQGLQDAGNYTVPFSAKQEGMRSGIYNVSLWCDDVRYQIRLTETE